MIRFVSGDMFEQDFDVRVNTVNCVGVMGAGVALAFKERYPEMFREYKHECDAGNVQPGKLHVWETLQGDRVVNFPTKRHWRDMSRYEDIEAGLRALRDYLTPLGDVAVAVPALGCGHGGLDWSRVSEMIREQLESLSARISVFEPRDSRRLGRRARDEAPIDRHALSEAGIGVLAADDAGFPKALDKQGVGAIFARGDHSINELPRLAVLASFKPTEREVAAATKCIEAISRDGLAISLNLSGKVAREFIDTAISRGGSIIAWLAEGIQAYRIPQWMHHVLNEHRVLLLSVAPPNHRWNPRYAKDASVCSATLADAVLITDPSPTWLSAFPIARELGNARRLFHVNYGQSSSDVASLLDEVRSAPIGRMSVNGAPNLVPVLAAIEQHAAEPAQSATPQVAIPSRRPNPAARREPVQTKGKVSGMEQPYLIDVTPDNLFNAGDREAEQPAASKRNGKQKKNGKNNGYEPPNLAKAIRLPVPDFSDPNRRKTCLEVDFPIAPINALSKLEGNAGKPIYQMSKWWARRRSSIFRAMLIAAATEAPDNPEEAAKLVWDHYYCNHQKAGSFKKLRVLDPFMGGGTTLVEGSRLGFQLTGVDLNPVAWFIVKNELACSDPAQVKAFFDEIEAEVKPQIQPFYTTTCPRGHQGRWIDVRTDQPAPSDLDPINLAPEERKHYRWEGPEVIYTFWAKHGPCAGSQGQPCGHRTPIFRSPVIAEKKLTAYYVPIDCPACGHQFHAELGETRMAPGCERVVVENEFPFTEVTQTFAQELKDYSKGKAMEKRQRVERLLAGIETEFGFQCPQCQAFAGDEVKRVLTRHAKPSTRAGDIKKKDFGIQSKHVFMYLLIDPRWFEGVPGQDTDGREYGGWAGAEPEATARWWERRLEELDLIEVRGRVKLADDEAPSTEDEEGEELSDETAVDESTEDQDRKKYGPPSQLTLADGTQIHTRVSTVPKQASFRCDGCGSQQELLEASRRTAHTPPIAPYAILAYCPICERTGHCYSGRWFKAPDQLDIAQAVAAEREWLSRSRTDLCDSWPQGEIAFSMRTHIKDPLPEHGYRHWWQMFNSRQLLGHAALLAAIHGAYQRGYPLDIAEQALGAFQQYLRNQNMFAFYHKSRDCLAPALSNSNYNPKNLPIEVGVFSQGYGPWSSTAANVCDGLEWARQSWDAVTLDGDSSRKSIRVSTGDELTPESHELLCGSATTLGDFELPEYDLTITDPPFGDNLYYGDLADFFYVWLRNPLLRWYEGLPEKQFFVAPRTPRTVEAVENTAEHPDDRESWEREPVVTQAILAVVRERAGDPTVDLQDANPLYRRNPAAQFYCDTLTASWAEAAARLRPGGMLAFTFHHSEYDPWIDVLESLFSAGLILEATYPIRSDETKGSNAEFGSKKIEYDIIHVCRKRHEEPSTVAWARMRRWVKDEAFRLKVLLERTHGQELAFADLQIILIGKSLEFYSQHYGQVLKGDGQPLLVREAVLGVKQLVNDLLREGTGGTVPPESAEPLTRLMLSIFELKDEITRDELRKIMLGTGFGPEDLQGRGWIRILGTVAHTLPLDERMSYFTQRGRTRKAALKTDLDQAHFLIGAARDGSGLNIDRELDNWAANLKRSTDAILRWYAETALDADVKSSAERAVRLVEAWRNKPQRRDAQMSLFAELDEAAETGAT